LLLRLTQRKGFSLSGPVRQILFQWAEDLMGTGSAKIVFFFQFPSTFLSLPEKKLSDQIIFLPANYEEKDL
jgi:hypothetical protein